MKKGHIDIIERAYNNIPAFSDIFTEETFYIFAFFFVLFTIFVAFVLSRFVTLKPMK